MNRGRRCCDVEFLGIVVVWASLTIFALKRFPAKQKGHVAALISLSLQGWERHLGDVSRRTTTKVTIILKPATSCFFLSIII